MATVMPEGGLVHQYCRDNRCIPDGTSVYGTTPAGFPDQDLALDCGAPTAITVRSIACRWLTRHALQEKSPIV